MFSSVYLTDRADKKIKYTNKKKKNTQIKVRPKGKIGIIKSGISYLLICLSVYVRIPGAYSTMPNLKH